MRTLARITQTGLVRKVERCILVIRDQKVMLDRDLAGLYGVSTRRLNEQVRRNIARFPSDFMFQLTAAETEALRSQTATTSGGWGGRRYEDLERRYNRRFKVVFVAIREFIARTEPDRHRIGF